MRVFTAELLGLLGDLTHTASKDPDLPGLGAIELHTGRGAIGTDPGYTDLLCGSSTNRYVAAHAYTRCDGQLDAGKPFLVPTVGAKAIVDVFKTAAKNRLHAVDIHHDGDTLRISEDPNLVDDGLSLRLILGDIDDYPIGVYRILGRELRTTVALRGRGEPTDPAARTLTAPARLEPFLKVAKRAGTLLHLYRTHQDELIQIQIGDTYRGVIMPVHADEDDAGDTERPDIEVHAPDLPDPDPAPAGADPDQAALGVPEPAGEHTDDPDQGDLLVDPDTDDEPDDDA